MTVYVDYANKSKKIIHILAYVVLENVLRLVLVSFKRRVAQIRHSSTNMKWQRLMLKIRALSEL